LAAELRDFAAARLPAHMVPADVVVLGALPIAPNGKLDRGALPALEPARALDGTRTPPRTSLERDLARLWCELLELPQAGVDDDFFAIGGASLRVAWIVVRVHDLLGVELPMRALYEAPTIARLAALIERPGGDRADEHLCFTPSLVLADEARPDDE